MSVSYCLESDKLRSLRASYLLSDHICIAPRLILTLPHLSVRTIGSVESSIPGAARTATDLGVREIGDLSRDSGHGTARRTIVLRSAGSPISAGDSIASATRLGDQDRLIEPPLTPTIL